MSQGSCSSQIRCRCGIFANHFTSTTPLNPGRQFFKCPKPKNRSCGYFEWEDEISFSSDLVTTKDVTSSWEAIKNDKDKLKEELIALKALHKAEAAKVTKLEEKVLKTRMMLMISWALFVGFVAASMMK
ncbi:PREDICTED: uncharacterized protein At1g43920, Chloroplastic-like [Nicotiana attenuata]|uniref:uncharacterized protein At1g43920, Chloroplastic-like n=1 Tax=Nicotiana attenuata TaxID=49451 RepID=UPI0009055E1B|nr:PREDICTED: uncharacterized protein At1g43920, Chloroplastic-like [Nicotiana attenuata]XP_019266857.1 PREDICTED: uncharacterized protein At1g43920, Chloroplastic-like [Nicotiana attenuata]